jgi:hypothetical protein
MRRIVLHVMLSLSLYIGAFGSVLDRPLSLGALQARIETGLARGRAVAGPKLVILAGSNGPYSHRCATIEPLIGRPCINAGVAVGIGLDYLFARWKPELHPGDIVYLPLEEAQYIRPREANSLGPDAAIMLRHDRATLRGMPPDRQVAALFSNDLRALAMSAAECAMAPWLSPAKLRPENSNGDRIGHTAALAARNALALAAATPDHPGADRIGAGYGAAIVAGFLDWAYDNGIVAAGGLPAGFADSPIPGDSIAAIETIFREHRAGFVELPNWSRYPRSAFFDTQDHLNEEAQIVHSVLVGQALAAIATKPAPSR